MGQRDTVARPIHDAYVGCVRRFWRDKGHNDVLPAVDALPPFAARSLDVMRCSGTSTYSGSPRCRLRSANMGAKTLLRSVSPVFPSQPAWHVLCCLASSSMPGGVEPRAEADDLGSASENDVAVAVERGVEGGIEVIECVR